MIHVCSLAALPETVRITGASHVLTVMANVEQVARPVSVLPANHLKVSMDDITEEIDGFVAPSEMHIEQVLTFVRGWDRSAPLVVHCYAGISRSTRARLRPSARSIRTVTRSRSPGRSARPRRSLRRTGVSSALPIALSGATAACCARSTRWARVR